jgi:hypothetical protein
MQRCERGHYATNFRGADGGVHVLVDVLIQSEDDKKNGFRNFWRKICEAEITARAAICNHLQRRNPHSTK